MKKDTKQTFLLVSGGLTSLCGGLQNLKQLKIDYEWYSKSVILFLEILQSLPMLETLDFEILAIEDYTRFSSKTLKGEDDDDIFHSKISIINTSELKSIRLLLCLDSSMFRDFFIKSNALFDFICKSCPVLEIFDLVVRNGNDSSDDSSLDSDMLDFTGSGGGFLNLDLTKQVHLKEIKIKQDIYNYYTFDHEPGKSWVNIKVLSAKNH